ncbi:hypothetical protein EJB05_31400, partial [Eragrostis curvula]
MQHQAPAAAVSPAISHAEHGVESVKQQLCRMVASPLSATATGVDVEPMLDVSRPGFGDYQCNNAMSLFARIRGTGTSYQNPIAVGQAIANNLPPSDIVESTSAAGPGYVNIVISSDWIAERIQSKLIHGIKTWAPKLPVKRALLDFSSPNIAKEMHVGHIRSTIIGDTLARMFQFANVEVLRRNHVGDWGTQSFYKASKTKFDEDEDFKGRAQQAVAQLQQGQDRYRAAWKNICQISRDEFDLVYKRFGVELEEKMEGGEIYNPYIPPVLEEFTAKGLITENEGARVIFIEGQNVPLIVVKKDGGFNYASTDLAALWYRLNMEKAEWIIYVTDVGQQQHFHKFFSNKMGRGKIADWTDYEIEKTSEIVGLGAVKYADLKNNRLTDYTFSFEQMLSDKGNTAVYLQYTHACICSIIRRAGKDIEKLKMSGSITCIHSDERTLGLHLIRFQAVCHHRARLSNPPQSAASQVAPCCRCRKRRLPTLFRTALTAAKRRQPQQSAASSQPDRHAATTVCQHNDDASILSEAFSKFYTNSPGDQVAGRNKPHDAWRSNRSRNGTVFLHARHNTSPQAIKVLVSSQFCMVLGPITAIER